MISGSGVKRVGGARAATPVAEVTRIGSGASRRAREGAPPEARSRRQLYLARAGLSSMTEQPLILVSRTLSGEQTQIVRRPVRKASGRRWIFIFNGAAGMATLLALWLGLSHREPGAQPRLVAAAAPVAPPREASLTRPIVAPLGERPLVVASSAARSVAPAPRSVRTTALASGRHTLAAAARIGSSSRLAAHRPARPSTTVAWVDPFVDR